MGAPAPERFGRYDVVRTLGGGAMGEVYQARDAALGRDVAIKVMRRAPGVAAELFRARFDAEARALAALRHPAVVAIYDVGWEGDDPYLVMELVPGGSLRDRLDAGPLAEPEVRALALAIAGALDAAHGAGILHRDVKPANVLGRPGEWKLADFGIAHVPGSELTMTGQFLGTPAYAAPEALLEGQHTPAADLYGLGATLHAALTGAPPSTTSYRALAPSPLGRVIDDLLARDPAARPSAAQAIAALTPEPARAVTPVPAPPRGRDRAWLPWAIGGGVVAVGLVALLASSGGGGGGGGGRAPVGASAAMPMSPSPSGSMVSFDPSTGAISIDEAQLAGDRPDKAAHELADAVREAEDGHLDPALDKLDDLLADDPTDQPVAVLRASLAQLRGETLGDEPGPPGRRKKHKRED